MNQRPFLYATTGEDGAGCEHAPAIRTPESNAKAVIEPKWHISVKTPVVVPSDMACYRRTRESAELMSAPATPAGYPSNTAKVPIDLGMTHPNPNIDNDLNPCPISLPLQPNLDLPRSP